MKVLIINSPLFRDHNPLYDEDSLPPIGLGLLATTLRIEGIEVELVDAVHERIPLKKLEQIVTEKEPSFVAINIFTTNYELVKDLVCDLQSSKIHWVIGGLSTRTLKDKIFTWNTDDKISIVFGDGEHIIKDIVNNDLKEEPVEVIGNKKFYKVDNASTYFSKDISNIPLDRSFFKNEPIDHPFGFLEANIITSRGCVYNCAFCAAASSLNKDLGIREKSFESVVNELKSIQIEFPDVTSIRVLDDLFLKYRKSIETAINLFSLFEFNWRSMAHVQTFNKVDLGLLKKLKKSGCQELFIGIESGSPTILKQIHKNKDVNRVKQNLRMVLEAGISIKGYFIYGFPNETMEDFEKTYQLALYLKKQSSKLDGNFRTSVFQFRPYHGTELYHDMKKNYDGLDEVTNVKGKKELSSLVGRIQFNFHSGNYSNETNEVVEQYIYQTMNLNDSNLYDNVKNS